MKDREKAKENLFFIPGSIYAVTYFILDVSNTEKGNIKDCCVPV
jgi:hypothetical protein